MKTKYFILLMILCVASTKGFAQKVDYSVVTVPLESSSEFTKITNDNDYVCMPIVKRNQAGCNWLSNRIINISPDGSSLAFVATRNNTTNIYVKGLEKLSTSVQRTNRQAVLDFNYSPDGKYICFSEKVGNTNQLFQTDAKNGFVCRQITSGAQDYSPVYAKDMSRIFFARVESNGCSIWSFNIKDNFLSSYTIGMNPVVLKDGKSIICTRNNSSGKSEIWRINTESGVEECIVSDPARNFTSPVVSPDGQWIAFVGSNELQNGKAKYYNTDIFASKLDGSSFTQLTYHAADDLSPVWSQDGRYIYFISQRGSVTGTANIWRMTFNY